MTTLMEALTAAGFSGHDTGGGCLALVRVRGDTSDVISRADGGDWPTESDWLLCTYAGNWLDGDGAQEPTDMLDNETSPVTLLEAVRMLETRNQN